MRKETLVLSILVAGFIALPSFAAQAGCCDGDMTATASCSMTTGNELNIPPTSTVADQLSQPVSTVFDNYTRIQTALAKDSVEGVTQSAEAIASAIKNDPTTSFSAKIVQQAVAVAKATDLAGAREAFKPLSQSLIEYVSKYPALAGSYRQVHCSMADASWLQTESVVNNPYLGKSMPHCGQFVKEQAPQDHSMHMH